ncbi:ALQxL family class IV lanthipeptide [Streptomyces sp. NPDC012623]
MENDLDALQLLSGEEVQEHALNLCEGHTCNGGSTCGISCQVTN